VLYPALLLCLVLSTTSWAGDATAVHIKGNIVERYYPNPDLKIITHLIVQSDEGKSFLLVDHPGFLAVGEKVDCYALKGKVHQKTGARIYYYCSPTPPTQAEITAAAERIYKKYRDDVGGLYNPTPP
jgi:hypothetical protein